jgi:chromosome segregation ATPase
MNVEELMEMADAAVQGEARGDYQMLRNSRAALLTALTAQADRVKELEEESADLAMLADQYKAERDTRQSQLTEAQGKLDDLQGVDSRNVELIAENQALQSKFDALAKQEPVAYGIYASNTGRLCQFLLPNSEDDMEELAEMNPAFVQPLYPAAGAQPKENT